MARMHALELVLDEAGRASVVEDWRALRDAGLPSQLDHRGPTNAPHLTVVAAPLMPEAAIDVARVRLGGLLPVRARVAGLLVLGEERVTLAWSVDVGDDVQRRVLAVRAQAPDRHPRGWLPHVTLARRLPRDDLPRALEVLDGRAAGRDLVLAGLRRWDPECEKVEHVLV